MFEFSVFYFFSTRNTYTFLFLLAIFFFRAVAWANGCNSFGGPFSAFFKHKKQKKTKRITNTQTWTDAYRWKLHYNTHTLRTSIHAKDRSWFLFFYYDKMYSQSKNKKAFLRFFLPLVANLCCVSGCRCISAYWLGLSVFSWQKQWYWW